ncbi:PspC domain-containing protein [Jatrophihabitans telluris]|uniref:PspC domain-containing protein n=1 Tax=Jatrophihabitans telluris TaxID=2038343 RepID=A0ABY4QXD7_9ACTN|nr:PspC domain-containing protein [Jatrophihabitans telluris]UQX87862.1 PspC domain-containing protein [Jatrophihabitans telluris]
MTTTMNTPGGPNDPSGPLLPPPPAWRPPSAVRPPLRRSRTDRMLSGVAGGLGEYFGVDAVIFRVVFAVLSFFGGVGLIVYLACWVLIPEPEQPNSVFDRAVEQLRLRKIPPWIVIIGGALVVWAAWFSWWAPGPTFPAIAVIAVLLIVLVRRSARSNYPTGWVGGPPSAYPPFSPQSGPPESGFSQTGFPQAGFPVRPALWPSGPESGAGPAGATGPVPQPGGTEGDLGTEPTISLTKDATVPTGAPRPLDVPVPPFGQGEPPQRLAPPLNDFRVTMRDWYSEAREAQIERRRRRRPIRVAVGALLLVGLTVIGIVDAVNRVPFGSYLWFVFAVLGLGLLVSLIARRTVWEYLPPLLLLVPALIVMGATPASLTDGSGKSGLAPTSLAQLADERQFAGDTVLDLTKLPALTADRRVEITQAAGRVELRVPATLNVIVDATVHVGDIEVGQSRAVGDFVAGLNSSLVVSPGPGANTASPVLTVRVRLTAGHVQITRVPN